MQPIRRYFLPLLLAALCAGPPLAGCAGMPLQEMSDARQAIRAAERAGAEQHAPEVLGAARESVERARVNLHKGEYRQAREEAELARQKAMEARTIAESAQAPAPGP
jgi:hypothetical protein